MEESGEYLCGPAAGPKYHQLMSEVRRKGLARALAENKDLVDQNAELKDQNGDLKEQLAAALAENKALKEQLAASQNKDLVDQLAASKQREQLWKEQLAASQHREQLWKERANQAEDYINEVSSAFVCLVRLWLRPFSTFEALDMAVS